ncbi:hydroxyethylthiazole kinase [bacterium]|nr:hydroxyethylthiazole kinase [bacterium]MDY3022893.1 hydroxyethylthiazole kinase [Oliverpabstia sp.]
MQRNVREQVPLVHCITNYVTVNDCANILLACGGSPIMADDEQEVEEITSVCGGLTINIGTLNSRTVKSMMLAGRRANALGHPVLLDPVGVGASALRTRTAIKLLEMVRFTAVRGNISEIKTLALGSGNTKGVDADVSDAVTEENMERVIAFAGEFSRKTGAVTVITGAVDLAVDGKQAYVIQNGHPMMSKVTGTGCMLSAMMAAYLTANKDTPLQAAAAAVCAMGIAGERAYEKMLAAHGGSGSYRMFLMDEISNMNAEILEQGARYEVYEM